MVAAAKKLAPGGSVQTKHFAGQPMWPRAPRWLFFLPRTAGPEARQGQKPRGLRALHQMSLSSCRNRVALSLSLCHSQTLSLSLSLSLSVSLCVFVVSSGFHSLTIPRYRPHPEASLSGFPGD